MSPASFLKEFDCSPKGAAQSEEGEPLSLPSGKHSFVNRIRVSGRESNSTLGSLITLHDLAYVQLRACETRRFIQTTTFIGTVVLALLMLVVAEITRRLWIQKVGKGLVGWNVITRRQGNDVEPIISDVRRLISQLESERKVWNAESIRQLISDHLHESEIFVVSNREPYIHHKRDDGSLDLERPASGLVTALEPIISVCKGT